MKRKLFTFVLTFTMVFVSIATKAPVRADEGDNNPLLINGSFESELDSSTMQVYKAQRVTAETGKVRTGTHALKIGAEKPDEESAYPLWLYNGGKGMVNFVIKDVKPNTKYKVTAYYYNETGVSMRVGVLDIESYKSFQSGRLNSTYKNFTAKSTDWTEVTLEITSGPRSTELYAFALTNWTGKPTGAGAFYVDDFSITDMGAATETVTSTINYTAPNYDTFPLTIPNIKEFVEAEVPGYFNIDKDYQIIYTDVFSQAKAEYFANLLLEKGTTKNVRVDVLVEGDDLPETGIIVMNQDLSYEFPANLTKLRHEAYEINISSDRLIVNAEGIGGVQNGLMTLVQAFVQRDSLPSGQVIDYTEQQIRGLQVDTGRRFYTIEWLKNEIEQLAYQKMNTMQLRLKDNEGIRYESKVAPQFVDTAGGFWTQEEVKDLVAYARSFNVQIIPEIDFPGHSEQDGVYFDDSWLLAPGTHVLDFTNPEVREYMKKIYREAFDLFEADIVHIGGDEYFQTSGFKDPEKRLANWAIEKSGDSSATQYDALKLFFNEVTAEFLDEGKRVLVWNDNIKSLTGPVTLDPRITIDFWAGTFYSSIRASTTMLVDGYESMGSAANLYHDLWPENDKLDRPLPTWMYNTWTRFTYSTGYGIEHVTPNTKSLGQVFPIWDDAHGYVPEYILSRTLFPRLSIFSDLIWGGYDRSLDYKEFERLTYSIGPLKQKGFSQVRMDYNNHDLQLIVDTVSAMLPAFAPANDNVNANLISLNAKIAAIKAGTVSANPYQDIFEVIRLYENLRYVAPTYGDVTVNYVDELGVVITNPLTIKRDVENGIYTYATTVPLLNGYTFVTAKEDSASLSGDFKKASQTITLIYNDDNRKPIDPTDPLKPVDPTNPDTPKLPTTGVDQNNNIQLAMIAIVAGLIIVLVERKRRTNNK